MKLPAKKAITVKLVAVVGVSGETASFINETGSTYDVAMEAFASLFPGGVTQDLLISKLNYKVEGKICGSVIEPVSTF